MFFNMKTIKSQYNERMMYCCDDNCDVVFTLIYVIKSMNVILPLVSVIIFVGYCYYAHRGRRFQLSARGCHATTDTCPLDNPNRGNLH